MQTAIKWERVDSSNIQALAAVEDKDIVCVRFNNGGLYSYLGCTHEMFTDLRMAPSIGRYLHYVIKALPYTRWESEEELINYLNS